MHHRGKSSTPHPHPPNAICLAYQWGKNSCSGQILHSPPLPLKNCLPCLSVGGKFLYWPNLALPTPTRQKLFALFISGEQFLHRPNLPLPTPPPKNYLPCLFSWRKNCCTDQVFRPPPPPNTHTQYDLYRAPLFHWKNICFVYHRGYKFLY